MIFTGFMILGYFFVGSVTGGVFSYWHRLDKNDDIAFMTGGVAIFWPIAWCIFCVLAVCVATVHVCEIVGRQIGRTRHKHKIVLAKTQMMEEDLARYNGHMELATRYDYQACAKCYGSGCKSCKNLGVERVPA